MNGRTHGDGIVRMKQSMMVRHWCFEGRWNDSSDPSMIRSSPSKATTRQGYEWRYYPSSTTRRWVAREYNNKMVGGIRRRQCLLPDEAGALLPATTSSDGSEWFFRLTRQDHPSKYVQEGRQLCEDMNGGIAVSDATRRGATTRISLHDDVWWIVLVVWNLFYQTRWNRRRWRR